MPRSPEELALHLSLVTKIMAEWVPFNTFLGLRVENLAEGRAVIALPFRPELVGDSARPALHGGVLSALADTCGGTAVWTAVGPEDRVSTIDLRVDYLRPAPLEELLATADVLRVGNRVGVSAIHIVARSRPDQVLAEGKGVYAVRRADDRSSI
jgi:uncharacterized protein (TIGR00369 family)